ncbi:DUF6264 family protein [Microbacterium sp. ZW T5_45]|uniref:DUF6264 family protein n=1 Tax=Microbacterium sp. ZW T5_45 TaxID=3378080 RepID=UPI00385303E4
MTDQRPQYGELATPEEQRRAAGLPPLDEVPPSPDAAPELSPAGSAVPPVASAPPPTPARRNPVDRFATIGLLAYGLVNVVSTAMSYLNLPAVMTEAMKILGVEGEFTNYAQGRLWGTIAAIVLFAGWAATTVFALRRLRTGKLSWWVPLVGAAATMIAASICVAIPTMNDPAFIAYVNSMNG